MAESPKVILKTINHRPTCSSATTLPQHPATAAQAPARAAQPATTDFEEVPVSQMRKTIARRLAESMFTAPHFYLTMTIDMDAAVAARVRINELSQVKISFNDIVLESGSGSA